MRVGFGYDVHRLIFNRKLVLGGVIIPWQKGLDGHSDADVIIHSLIDALLGAMGEGDIGKHFPDNDEKYKDISSTKLLKATFKILKEKRAVINNIDVSVIIEEPQLSPFINEMRLNLSKILNLPLNRINIKATTNEGMGFVGRNEGIAAYCVVAITDFTD
ncbi:MAG: 2-C-methyl-D-erythritol 2,4-cyclodiphosphate synthase [Candidatus Atribacteria bacterium]|nr:2-C-methyl-D-erythritol 2,4-cyclodiphosphate synthase [Candidatus Atribacteria bacterium]